MRISSLHCLALSVTVIACSNGAKSSGGGGSAGSGGSTGSGGNGVDSTSSTASGKTTANSTGVSTSSGDSTTSTGTSTGSGTELFSGVFAHGINTGYTPPFTDSQTSQLASMTGSDSVRIKMPEDFFNTWGYNILVGTMMDRASYGMGNHIAWFCTPTQAHSTAPSGGDLEYYIPTNLYEPIFDSTGKVNQSNYWAYYIFQTVTQYSPYVKVYSVWNEPDWVADYSTAEGWATKAPTSADLPRFNGSIYDYVRMLRIAKEVAATVDPTVKIATGGLGYPTFLQAITEYTDNPDSGTVTSDYPSKGIDYVDVLDLHYYPLYTPGNSDDAVNGLIAHRDSFAKVLSDAGLPARPVIYTETGAPHVLIPPNPGGPDYARNYLLKSMVESQAKGFSGIEWFILSDGSDTSTDPYQSMGLYSNLSTAMTIPAATKTDTGVASTTLGTLTKGYLFDSATTATLTIPSGTFATVLTNGTKKVLVAWATTSDGKEDATGTITLPFAATEMMWDFATSSATTTHAQGDSVDLGSDPRFFVSQ